MLRSNSTFCDNCCFSSVVLLPTSLQNVVNCQVFFINICCFAGTIGASFGIFKVHVKQPRHTYHSASAFQFPPNRTTRERVTMLQSHPFFKWRPRHRNFTSGFGLRDFAHLGRWKSTWIPTFGEISQSTGEILLLPVSENKRRPCWYSTACFDFTFASPSACHCASAYQITSKSDHPRRSNVMTSYPFFMMAAVSHIGVILFRRRSGPLATVGILFLDSYFSPRALYS